MTESTGVATRASLVQKAIKERKESLMARARAYLGITSLEPYCPVSEPLPARLDAFSVGLKRAAPNKHGEPSACGSKDARKSKSLKVSCHKSKSKTRSINSLCCEASKKVREDKRVNPELEHCHLEIQNGGKEETSPNSSISSPSSVMRTRFGEDSLQLYKACLLPMDQIELASMAHGTLEEIVAHDLMRSAAVAHQLTLQCAKWKNEAEEKAVQLNQEKEHAIEAKAQHEQRLHALEHQLIELKAWSEKAEQALLKSKLEIERLEQAGKESFCAGRAAGRLEMAASEEFQAAIRQARVSGAEDYLRSPTFKLILAGKAAEHEVIGFMRCQSQVLKLGGFKEGFDIGLLDSAKDGNLESPVPEVDDDAAEDDDPEFGNLVGEITDQEAGIFKG